MKEWKEMEERTKEKKEMTMTDKRMMKEEVKEAVKAGEEALTALLEVREKLDSARNWGIFDMFGGGLFGTLMKRSRMKEAAGLMEDAKTKLHIFQRMLFHTEIPAEFQMEVSGFLSFADFFFDGIVFDYLVQRKINEAREQAEDAIGRVCTILDGFGKFGI